ncbi:MAG: hypothetical protein RLZZ142_1065 [Verrucomicrobiota bacterium]
MRPGSGGACRFPWGGSDWEAGGERSQEAELGITREVAKGVQRGGDEVFGECAEVALFERVEREAAFFAEFEALPCGPAFAEDMSVALLVLARKEGFVMHDSDCAAVGGVVGGGVGVVSPVLEQHAVEEGDIPETAEADDHVPVLAEVHGFVEKSGAQVGLASSEEESRGIDGSGPALGCEAAGLVEGPDADGSLAIAETLSSKCLEGTGMHEGSVGRDELSQSVCADGLGGELEALDEPAEGLGQPTVIGVHEGNPGGLR